MGNCIHRPISCREATGLKPNLSITNAATDTSESTDRPPKKSIEALIHKQEHYYSQANLAAGWPHSYKSGKSASRTRYFDWYLNIVDQLNLDRTYAVRAIRLLDYFISKSDNIGFFNGRPVSNNQEHHTIKLAAITSLFTVIKTHGTIINPDTNRKTIKLSLNSMIKLIKQRFTAEDIKACELLMLKTLEWHINPPLAEEFIDEYFKLLPSSQRVGDTQALLSEAISHAQLSARSISLVSQYNPQEIALAAILYAMELNPSHSSESQISKPFITRILKEIGEQALSEVISATTLLRANFDEFDSVLIKKHKHLAARKVLQKIESMPIQRQIGSFGISQRYVQAKAQQQIPSALASLLDTKAETKIAFIKAPERKLIAQKAAEHSVENVIKQLSTQSEISIGHYIRV